MKIHIQQFKKGAASFYVVAFSTLILLVLAVSFATVIISEIERTSNEDLSQSAYDSAMAGIEDAKLAFYNYQTCKTQDFFSMSAACKDIVTIMESNPDCYMVGRILGRIGKNDESEVMIEDSMISTSGGSTTSNNMQQAYTCVKIQTVLSDYRSTLSSTNPTRVVKVNLKSGVNASDINKMRISWYSGTEEAAWKNFFSNKVAFPQIGSTTTATPPTISVALVQTADSFRFSDFDQTQGSQTDRAMVYLVPTNNSSTTSSNTSGFGAYKAAYNGATNIISRSDLLKSNDHTTSNLPYAVYCDEGADTDFLCSATLELPEAVGGGRNDNTFMFVVSLPYARPTTDFAIELFCKDSVVDTCGTAEIIEKPDGTQEAQQTNIASFSGVQVKIDSTGRANDLFRRVEARLESSIDSSFISLLGPLELYDDGEGNSNEKGLVKDYTVINEWNFR